MPTTNILPEMSSLEDVITALREIFAKNDLDVAEVKRVLSSYKSNRRDWKKYAIFDPHTYTRNLVDRGNGKYNLLAVCWGESQGSAIHDHSNSHCFVKVLDGHLKETLYKWPETEKDSIEIGDCPRLNQMEELSSNTYDKDQVTYISDEIGLHRMENPSHTDGTVSLHLYCPPFDTCRIFDDQSGKEKTVCVTFHTAYGEKVNNNINEINGGS